MSWSSFGHLADGRHHGVAVGPSNNEDLWIREVIWGYLGFFGVLFVEPTEIDCSGDGRRCSCSSELTVPFIVVPKTPPA